MTPNEKLSQYMATHKVCIASDRPRRLEPPAPGSFWWHQEQKLAASRAHLETITVEELAARAGTTVEEARAYVQQKVREGLERLRRVKS